MANRRKHDFCLFIFLSPHTCFSLIGPDNLPTAPLPSPSTYAVVTVQIYLSRSAKRTESSGGPAALAVTARAAAGRRQTTDSSKAGSPRKSGGARKTPSVNLHLRKSGSLLSHSSLDTPSYRSPVKSPSQYFQICY